jgi:uncharacterized protein (DUF1697 family)
MAKVTWIALVRGINVGRARPVTMADLRQAVESLGYEDVRTLLRSGNVVFSSDPSAERTIAKALERSIDRLAPKARIVVRSVDQLADVIEANPLPEAAKHGSLLHVMFLGEPLEAAERRAIEAANFGPDEVRVAKREIYVWYRNGMSGSDTAGRLAKLVKTLATDRNWNTVEKLLAMARAK